MNQSEIIKKRSHPLINRARQIRDGKQKAFIFCEGWKIGSELLKSGYILDQILLTEKNKNEFLRSIHSQLPPHVPIKYLTSDVMDFVSDLTTPPGIIFIAKRKPSSIPEKISFGLILNKLNLPQNVGAIFRTAEAAGVDWIGLTQDTSDPMNPKAIRASAGSVFRIPFSSGIVLEYECKLLISKDIDVFALDSKAEDSIYDINWDKSVVLVMGAEAHGFSDSDKRQFSKLLKIPMAGQVESLNVGTATAITLFEIKRVRKN